MKVRSRALGMAALLCSFAIAGAASAQERVKVRFGILTTASQAAFYVGTKKGIFAKYGFDVEVQPLATGVQANQSLAAGQVDWSGGGVESTVVAWATKLPFKAYSMYAKGGDSYGILVRNEAGCTCTNSVHSVRVHDCSAEAHLVMAWESPFCKLSCEIEGHPLGGGMLKLEPGEANQIGLPSPGVLSRLNGTIIEEAITTMRTWRHYAPES